MTGWADGYDVELREFGMTNLARDSLGLVAVLGEREAAAGRTAPRGVRGR